VYETQGITLTGDENTPEAVAAQFEQITEPNGQTEMPDAFSQTKKYAFNAAQARGLKLDW
jgi:hypothetical protein